MGYTDSFGCCLEDALSKVDVIEDTHHLYNTTKVCNMHFDPPLNASNFISAVIYFYIHETENKTVCEEDDLCLLGTRTWYMLYVCFWTIALLSGIIGNVAVCLAFLQSPMVRRSVTNYFVTSLAVSDLLVVLFIVPIKIHFALHNQEFCAPLAFCRTLYTIDMIFFSASITNILVISVDRYIAIMRPFDYRDLLSPRRARNLICAIWLYAALWGLMVHFNRVTIGFDAVYVKNYHCGADNLLFFRISYIMVFYIPSFAMFCIYIRIMTVSRKHARHIDARRNSLVGHTRRRSELCSFFPDASYFLNHKLELRATKVVLVVYGTFLSCWLPLVFINTFQDLMSLKIASPIAYSVVSEVLPITNSLLNPFIYGILHRDFKRSIKRMLSTIKLEYQLIGSLIRRSSQSTRGYDASSQGVNQNLNNASGGNEINQNVEESNANDPVA